MELNLGPKLGTLKVEGGKPLSPKEAQSMADKMVERNQTMLKHQQKAPAPVLFNIGNRSQAQGLAQKEQYSQGDDITGSSKTELKLPDNDNLLSKNASETIFKDNTIPELEYPTSPAQDNILDDAEFANNIFGQNPDNVSNPLGGGIF